MLKKIMFSALAAAAIALNAPAAVAVEAAYDCGFNSVQQEDVTGQNYEGVAYGYVVDEGAVSIRCYITVNGAEASSTPTGTGIGAATTQGRVTFSAGDTDVVDICFEVVTRYGHVQGCVLTGGGGRIDCRVLRTIRGRYGPILIANDGDVFINGVQWYRCPPHQAVLSYARRAGWQPISPSAATRACSAGAGASIDFG